MVDEIQRLPDLLNEVHRFIEERGLVLTPAGQVARQRWVVASRVPRPQPAAKRQ